MRNVGGNRESTRKEEVGSERRSDDVDVVWGKRGCTLVRGV